MKNLELRLRSYRRRVRIVRAWQGLAIGAALCGGVCLVLACLDFLSVAYADPAVLAGFTGAGAFVAALVNCLRPVPTKDLADSIDRRAEEENRLGTAAEAEDGEMRVAQREDALRRLDHLRPSKVFPVRLSVWHGGAVVSCLLAAIVFLLGNSPVLDSAKKAAEKREMKANAKEIERVVKPMLERKADDTTVDAKALATKMDALRKEMERGRTPKEEVMAKANKLAEEAQKSAASKVEQAQKAQSTAKQTLLKMAQARAMKELQMTAEDLDEAQLAEASEMDDTGRDELADRLESQIDMARRQLGMGGRPSRSNSAETRAERTADLQRQMDELSKQIASGKGANGESLTPEQKARLKKLMEQLKEIMKGLKLSQKVAEFMSKWQAMKEYKDIQEMIRKAYEAGKIKMGKDGKTTQIPELTDQEVQEMKESLKKAMARLEKMAREMSDAEMKEMLEAYKKALQEALEEGIEAGMCNGLMPGFGFLPGFSLGLHPWGPGAPSQDQFFENRGVIPLNDEGQDSAAKTVPFGTRGERQDTGEESYVEVAGPTKPGERSSVSYFKVFPQYKKQAEAALRKNQIPKRHEKRVRDYFDSLLQGGK